MLCLLINLDRSQDRLEAARENLAQAGIAFERLPAVDGRGADPLSFPEYDPKLAQRFYGRGLTSGEIGCYLSHLKAVERFLASDARLCLVLEDDMTLPEGAGRALAALQARLSGPDAPAGWEVVNLGREPHLLSTELGAVGAHVLYAAHYLPSATTALLWSRAGAEAFRAAHGPIFAPVDHYLRRFAVQRGSGLILRPALIRPSGAESVIDTTAPSLSGPARRTKRKPPTYFWAEFKRQMLNYFFALSGFVAYRRKLRQTSPGK